MFLLLVVKIPKQEQQLDANRVVGVDLGINVPLYAALNDNEYGGLSIGSREQFLNVRMCFSRQKRELQRSLRNTTKGGHGLGGMLFDRKRGNGIVYIVAGTGSDKNKYFGKYSAFYGWEEDLLTAAAEYAQFDY